MCCRQNMYDSNIPCRKMHKEPVIRHCIPKKCHPDQACLSRNSEPSGKKRDFRMRGLDGKRRQIHTCTQNMGKDSHRQISSIPNSLLEKESRTGSLSRDMPCINHEGNMSSASPSGVCVQRCLPLPDPVKSTQHQEGEEVQAVVVIAAFAPAQRCFPEPFQNGICISAVA